MPVTRAQLAAGTDATNRTAGDPYTTASISPGGNRLLELHLYAQASTDPPDPTVAGNGLTWVKVESIVTGAGPFNRLWVYRAMGASPSAGAVTFTWGATNMQHANWEVEELDGVNTSGTNGSGAIVQAVTGSAAGATTLEITLAAFGSGLNATFGVFAGGSVTWTPGAGFTELVDQAVESRGMMAEWKDTNDTTVDVTASGTTTIIGIAIEIAAAAAIVVTPGAASIVVTGFAPTVTVAAAAAKPPFRRDMTYLRI